MKGGDGSHSAEEYLIASASFCHMSIDDLRYIDAETLMGVADLLGGMLGKRDASREPTQDDIDRFLTGGFR